jgi:hypothetical protein
MISASSAPASLTRLKETMVHPSKAGFLLSPYPTEVRL